MESIFLDLFSLTDQGITAKLTGFLLILGQL